MKVIVANLIAIFITLNVFATHNKGGSINYTHVSGYTYLFTVRTFTDYVNAGSVEDCELILQINGESIIMHKVNGPPSPACPQGGEFICSEIKYNIFQVHYTLPGPGNYVYFTENPNRSNGICNIPNSISTPFTLAGDLVINDFLGPNDSPLYQNLPAINNALGTSSSYTPNVINPEADSLYYDFIFPNGMTLPPAIDTLFINHQTGTIIWDAPSIFCGYIFDVVLKEYKKLNGTNNYYYVGSTMQEIFTSDCIANPAIPNSVNDEDVIGQINLYPNPSEGLFEIDAENIKAENIKIINMFGSVIKASITTNDNNKITIDLGNVNKGLYFLQLTNENKNINYKKLIIQ